MTNPYTDLISRFTNEQVMLIGGNRIAITIKVTIFMLCFIRI